MESNKKVSNHSIAAGTTAISSVDDTAVFDIIHREYLSILQYDPIQPYVHIDVLYQRMVNKRVDYPTLVKNLSKMRNRYNCELMTTSSGAITHVKMTTNIDSSMLQTPYQLLKQSQVVEMDGKFHTANSSDQESSLLNDMLNIANPGNSASQDFHQTPSQTTDASLLFNVMPSASTNTN